jgi:hypothetical protein
MRLAGNSNENRYEALFNAISAKWLGEDDVYVRQFIFEVWQTHPGLFRDRKFPAASTPVGANARRFEEALKELGFSVVMAPQIFVGLSGSTWQPIDPCGEEAFAEFLSWLDLSPRANGEIMAKLGE